METFETISEWCNDTFGPVTPRRLVERSDEEFDELCEEVNMCDQWTEEAVKEAADVVITLARVPGLQEMINKKMAINRARKWERMGDGTGYHIKEA